MTCFRTRGGANDPLHPFLCRSGRFCLRRRRLERRRNILFIFYVRFVYFYRRELVRAHDDWFPCVGWCQWPTPPFPPLLTGDPSPPPSFETTAEYYYSLFVFFIIASSNELAMALFYRGVVPMVHSIFPCAPNGSPVPRRRRSRRRWINFIIFYSHFSF